MQLLKVDWSGFHQNVPRVSENKDLVVAVISWFELVQLFGSPCSQLVFSVQSQAAIISEAVFLSLFNQSSLWSSSGIVIISINLTFATFLNTQIAKL